jgi:hypothetical protein
VTRIVLVLGALVLGASLSILAVSCDGGNGGGAEPTPVPPELQEQLKRMALQAGDVPSGFRVIDEAFSTNQDVAGASADPEGQLVQLEQWGRILGYEVTYEPSGGTAGDDTIIFSLNSTASIYRTPEGASASFADAVNGARTTDWPAFFGGAVDIVVEEVSAPAVADEILWLRVRGKAEANDQTFAHDLVLMRTGTARGSIQAGSFGTEESKAPMEGLIRVQAERMMTEAP